MCVILGQSRNSFLSNMPNTAERQKTFLFYFVIVVSSYHFITSITSHKARNLSTETHFPLSKNSKHLWLAYQNIIKTDQARSAKEIVFGIHYLCV